MRDLKQFIKTSLSEFLNENNKLDISNILSTVRRKYLKETMVDEVWKLNNGYCEDIAYDFIDIIGGENQNTYIIDDGWFWSTDEISEFKTKTGEYWNVENLKKFGAPPLGWENLDKLDLNGHVWIYSNGKHYDVEILNGVNNFWDLPIYKRQINGLEILKK